MAGLVVLLQQFLVKLSSSRKLCFAGDRERSNLMRNKHAARGPTQTPTNEQCYLPAPSMGIQNSNNKKSQATIQGAGQNLVKNKKNSRTSGENCRQYHIILCISMEKKKEKRIVQRGMAFSEILEARSDKEALSYPPI